MNIHILYRVFLCFAYLLSQCNAICQNNDYSESLGLVAHQPYPIKIVCDGDYTIAGHISNTNGMLMVSPPNYSSTSYIEVSGYDVIECQLPQSKCGGLAFYDADKRFLSAISSKNGEKIQSNIPQNAFYMRLCKRTDIVSISYYAKLYKSDNRNVQAIIQEIHNQIKSLNGGLYAALVADYITVFQRDNFAYNEVDRNGCHVINPNIKEKYYSIFRIPIHLKTKHGTIIVAAEAKKMQKGMKGNSIIMARSTDGGKTFDESQMCRGYNPCLIYDEQHDRIFFLHDLNYSISTDDGQTWSDFMPMNIEKPKGWEKFYASPTTGIQLKNGILAAPYILMNGSGKGISKNANAVVYSADFGKTWKVTAATPDTIIANETTIAEYAPNQIMINARGGTEVHWGSPNPGRRVFVSVTPSKSDRKDWHIKEWKLHESDKQLIEPICNASFIACQYGKHRFGLFCNPYTSGKKRKNLMLQVSSDFTHWTKVGLLTPFNREVYGYCSLNYQNGQLSFVFEDKECGILYADLTPFMDEILTKMVVNKILYQEN